jgi:hypothetical protein
MTNTTPRVTRDAILKWVPLNKMRASATAQRDTSQARVDHILSNLDLEQIGVLTVSERDGHFYVMDGNHRRIALTQFFADDPATLVQCWVYTGLTEKQEAEGFLKLNDVRPVNTFQKFKIGVTAERDDELEITRIVRANGCKIAQSKAPGTIGAVGTLRRLYRRHGGSTLGRTVGIVNVAYGNGGLEAAVIGGVGAMLGRYNGLVDDALLVEKLLKVSGGAKGLMQRAMQVREQFGGTREEALAAAVVEVYNQGLGSHSAKRINSWWKTPPAEAAA